MEFILHLIVILLLAYLAGKLFEKIKLTKIIGYILIGVLAGPSLFNWYTENMVVVLDPLVVLALTFIAFYIGARLQISEIKKMKRQIFTVTFFQAFLTFISVMLFSFIFMSIISLKNSLPISIMLGAIAMATAPATVFALIDEFKARGPLTTMLLAIVAIDDGIAIITYSLFLIIAGFFVNGMAAISSVSLILSLKEIVLPVLFGLLAGGFFVLVTKKIKNQGVCVGCLIVLLVFLLLLAEYIQISPMLAAMILGFMAVNFGGLSETTMDQISKIENFIFVFFFVTAGASLQFNVLFNVGFLVIIYVLARWAGKVLGGTFGAKLAGSEEKVRRWLGWGLLPQAGVAIAFVHMTDRFLPQISATIMAIVLASIVLDEIIGPLGVELALFRSGETRS